MLPLLAILSVASAAPELNLPAGEDPEAWAQPLVVSGLERFDGARVDLTVGDDGWRLAVTSASGVVRTEDVTAPTTEADRERVAHLAASLLRGSAQALPLPTLPPRAPVTDDPQPERASARHRPPLDLASSEEAWEPPIEASVVEPVAIAPAAPASPRPDGTLPPPVSRPPPGAPATRADPLKTTWWVSAGAGLAMRHVQAPFASTTFMGGVRIDDRARLGAGGTFATPTPLVVDGPRRSMVTTDGLAGAWVGRTLEVGVLGGVSRRTFSEQRRVGVSPIVGAEASVTLQASPRTRLRAPTLRLQRDLVSTWIVVDDVATALPRTSLFLDFQVVISGRMDQSGGQGALGSR